MLMLMLMLMLKLMLMLMLMLALSPVDMSVDIHIHIEHILGSSGGGISCDMSVVLRYLMSDGKMGAPRCSLPAPLLHSPVLKLKLKLGLSPCETELLMWWYRPGDTSDSSSGCIIITCSLRSSFKLRNSSNIK
jgi:hypothetical protein